MESGPSGLADWPRPFVFRARHLDGRTVQPGESFYFDLNVFLLDRSILLYLVQTFACLAREGLGPRRGKAELQRVTAEEQIVYRGADQTISTAVEPMLLDLTAARVSISRIRIAFLTPTELKNEHKIADVPEFPVLFARVRDRIATLARLYAGDILDLDYQGTDERAASVQMTSCRLSRQQASRRSSKTGQAHSIGGFVGAADYQGELAEFLPFLEAGQWVGVGRQCVWGKGEIRPEILA